jgi:hypothetical protein
MENLPALFGELSGMLVDGTKSTYTRALPVLAKYYEDRRQASFDDFTRHLLSGTATKEKIEYEKMFKVTEDQYYALLNATVEDEEKEKSYIYANLYRSILEGKIPKDKYTRFIKVAKALPYSAIEILPICYIYKNYPTKNISLKKYLDDIYKNNRYEANVLDQNNIFILPTGMQYSDSRITINESFFNDIINVFFRDEELNPTTYNIELWKNPNALILSTDSFGDTPDITFIQNILTENDIRSEHMMYQKINHKDYCHIICIKNKSSLDPSNNFDTSEMELTSNVIEVTFSNEINNNNILNLNEEKDIQKFKNIFSD